MGDVDPGRCAGLLVSALCQRQTQWSTRARVDAGGLAVLPPAFRPRVTATGCDWTTPNSPSPPPPLTPSPVITVAYCYICAYALPMQIGRRDIADPQALAFRRKKKYPGSRRALQQGWWGVFPHQKTAKDLLLPLAESVQGAFP